MIDEPTPNPTAGMPPGREIVFDGQTLKRLTEAGLTWLRTNQQVVNALNVFPVPDGDTGTNMVLTMQSAFNEISESPENNAGKMAHAVAHGAVDSFEVGPTGERAEELVRARYSCRDYRPDPVEDEKLQQLSGGNRGHSSGNQHPRLLCGRAGGQRLPKIAWIHSLA